MRGRPVRPSVGPSIGPSVRLSVPPASRACTSLFPRRNLRTKTARCSLLTSRQRRKRRRLGYAKTPCRSVDRSVCRSREPRQPHRGNRETIQGCVISRVYTRGYYTCVPNLFFLPYSCTKPGCFDHTRVPNLVVWVIIGYQI